MFGDEAFTAHGLLASIIAAGVSTLGLASIAIFRDWGQRNSPYFSAFAIGVLLVAVGFHLIPEAFAENPGVAWKAMAAAAAAMLSISAILRLGVLGNAEAQRAAFGFASIVPLAFHSLIDGVVYETSFHGDIFTGLITSAGLLLHEFPEGVIAYFLLLQSGVRRMWAFFWATVASAFTTVGGALLGAFIFDAALVDAQDAVPFAGMLGGTAGALLYIIIFHLGPHASATPNRSGYMWTSFGVVVGLASIMTRMLMGGHTH